MDSLIAESWLEVMTGPCTIATFSVLLAYSAQVENAIGQRPQLTGNVFDMREQYKALADGANATRTISQNITVGKNDFRA